MFRAEERTAVRILFRELGFVEGLRLAGRVQTRVLAGEPFDELPSPESEDERKSREQIAPAIVLYDELLADYQQPRAYDLVEEIAVEGAVHFLSRTIGRLRKRDLLGMTDRERRDFVETKGEQFFNAKLRWETIEEDEVEFTVLECRFPGLCESVGYPELAPVFCKGDAKFFGGVEEDVDLDRPHTIAEGADTCPFHIYLDGDG